MKRKRWAVAVLVAAIVVAPLLWPLGPRPCRATFDQVRVGMTREEVVATVGAPPGDYTDGNYVCAPSSSWVGYCDRWVCNDAELLVHFEDDGTAAFVTVRPLFVPATPPTPLERIRTRVGF